ncbi:chemotaxis protein CheW [Serpentinicella sp. ANB-PHB4]|uniref:chemotaxis protein CheW n=1 Tax=Serpentinicella sp. ANB-PHB4 TaxID=3074076 RepID=UPI0028655B57|nr:chemotaxis protein CheW [Serpentinicella sp. ANB-PHB4]MDR5659245.1 chemotaxis protein CheW [Serpentinicella sp. ANB-PHB4]
MHNNQYVIFELNGQQYGVEIGYIQEITRFNDFEDVLVIPNKKEDIEGVINIRGDIIPILNLKKKFELKDKEIHKNAQVIIFKKDEQFIGLIVDNASQVLQIKKEHTEPLSDLVISSSEKSHCKEIIKINNKLIFILDIAHFI